LSTDSGTAQGASERRRRLAGVDVPAPPLGEDKPAGDFAGGALDPYLEKVHIINA